MKSRAVCTPAEKILHPGSCLSVFGRTLNVFALHLYTLSYRFVCSTGDLSWICVRPDLPESPRCDDVYERDIPGLLTDWEKMQQTGEVTVPAILSAAKAHNVASGSWMAFTDTGPKIDNMWTTIATAVYDGRLQTSAQVSPVHGNGQQHIIAVIDDDFSNEQRVIHCISVKNTHFC